MAKSSTYIQMSYRDDGVHLTLRSYGNGLNGVGLQRAIVPWGKGRTYPTKAIEQTVKAWGLDNKPQ